MDTIKCTTFGFESQILETFKEEIITENKKIEQVVKSLAEEVTRLRDQNRELKAVIEWLGSGNIQKLDSARPWPLE